MDISKATGLGRKLLKLKYCGAVIVAAGSASRMCGTDKILHELGGKPVIQRTVEAFQNCEAIKEIVVVTSEERLLRITALTRQFPKVQAVVAGGEDRAASVRNGLNALSDKVKLAAIHDGARPLVNGMLIDRVVRAANSYGAAVPVVSVKDTIKETTGGVVGKTLDRSVLRAVQTPQVFDFDLLRGALKKAAEQGVAITDDSSAVENMGMSVKTVEGDERNLKITTPLDLKIAEVFLEDLS